MEWEVEFTDEFGEWWNALSSAEQEDINASVILLQRLGPNLRFPHSSAVQSSKHSHMRELRIQHKGRPYRILYAFDPRRIAILLIGGDKTGNDRWYEIYVPLADKLYREHLKQLEKERKMKNGEELQNTSGKDGPGSTRQKRGQS
jgi:hypothetical protein